MKLHPDPVLDPHWQGEELAADATFRYLWLWYGFNTRLIAVPLDEAADGAGYEHGWCFPRDPAAVREAVADWDPDTQDEPTGWHKRATAVPRRAPHRDPHDPYNRPRCEHGAYMDVGCHTLVCHSTLAYQAAVRAEPATDLTAAEPRCDIGRGRPRVCASYPNCTCG